MAIYHFSAKVISRSNGSSAVAAAAYRSASRLQDERLGRAQDFSAKDDVIHSEVMLPDDAPERWRDREVLWNEVEAIERRKDAQLAREVEFSIPREMSREDGVKLASEFVQREFVDRGMVADLNVHWDRAEDGSPKPHAHVMLSTREAGPQGFGRKTREWNATSELQGWRERWAEHVNTRLLELGIEAQIDHRSYRDQGVELEPQHKIGPAGMRREDRGEAAERALEHREIARRNGEKIISEPTIALDAITRQQSTFTDHDLARFVHRHSDEPEQFARALSAVKTSPELVVLGVDDRGRERFSTREMVETERRLERSAEITFERDGHKVSAATLGRVQVAAEKSGLQLGEEQQHALEHITRSGDLAMTVGYAGTGKSAMLGVARDAWERSGFQVRGAALSGIAAETLEGGSGITSRTIASLEHAWGQGREELTSRDVLVIDEAGMIGSRQMERVISAAERAGAKLVLVGDPEQLQAIEAGAAFRALTERHGAAEITQVRRQREDWQRDATRELATGRTSVALDRYQEAGTVRAHSTHVSARDALVAGWEAERRDSPAASRMILAHTRADVAELNRLARERMRQAGDLGEELTVSTERGERTFAAGDRVMFLKNERGLGVKNGTLGAVQEITPERMSVRLDDGRQVGFELKAYADLDHGYASTIHKAQGVTVDRTHVLATPGLDRHAAYVALTRHRDGVSLHYGADQFADREALARTLSRERAKDTTLDYPAQAFAERRGITPRSEIVLEPSLARELTPAPKRSPFTNLSLRREAAPGITEGVQAPALQRDRGLDRAGVDYTRAWADAERMGGLGLPVLPHQKLALEKTREQLEALSPERSKDLRTALSRSPGLAGRGLTSQGAGELERAVGQEAKVRTDPALRAERFVSDWRALQSRRQALEDKLDKGGEFKRVDERMKGMVKGLERDPQVESLLRGKRKELGLERTGNVPLPSLRGELIQSLVRGRTLGLGR